MNCMGNRMDPTARAVKLLFLLLMLVAFPGVAAAQPSGEFKLLTVRVLDAASGQPIEDAEVSAPSLSWNVTPRPTNEWQFRTDKRGTVIFRVPVNDAAQFMLSVRHTNYAERGANWYTRAGKVASALPESFEFRLEPGGTIGGVVRDERGQPIPGAALLISGNTSRSYISGENSHNEFAVFNPHGTPERRSILSDSNGFWRVNQVSAELDVIQVDIVRPGGARAAFVAGTTPALQRGEKIALADLRATNAVLTIKDGMTIRGLVADGSGKPVPNVRIKERSGRVAPTSTYIFTNDLDGRFELKNRRAPQLALTAEAEGYAITSTSLLTAETNEARLVLAPLQPLRIRLVGQREQAVAGAVFEVIPYRSQNESLEWRGITDSTGRVTWTTAPQQEISFWIRSTNYPIRAVKLRPIPGEHVVQLRQGSDQSVRIALQVIDAATGSAIETFEVWRDLYGYRPFLKVGTGQRGSFTNEVGFSDFERGTGMAFRFQVRAEGYGPWTSDQLYFDEADQNLTARLERGIAPGGIVLQPDGKAAEGATVYLQSPNRGSLFANTQGPEFYAGQGALKERTASDGSFKLVAAEDNDAVVITHPSGFASMTAGELKRAREIRLEKFANLSGVLRIDGEPKKGERIHLKAPASWSGRNNFLLIFNATTDDQGAFSFTNLPPSTYALARTPHIIMGASTTESHRLPFDLKPGESKTIEYGFNGRSIVGHVEASGPVDWQNDPHLLAVKLPPGPEPPNYYDYTDVKAYEAAREAFGKSAAALAYERQQQQFQLLFDRDGNFRADDVPPGTYELRLRITKPPSNPNERYRRTEQEIGALVKEVTIPAGAGEFDLGSFELEVKGERIASTPLELRAVTLDDKPFDLTSLRGKPVLLTFWGNWAPQSVASLAPMHKVQQELGDRVSFVTVNLDEHNDLAQVHLGALTGGWVHTVLRGTNRVEAADRLAINTVPVTLILDASGRVVSRDVTEKRLRQALQRLLTKPATQAKKQ